MCGAAALRDTRNAIPPPTPRTGSITSYHHLNPPGAQRINRSSGRGGVGDKRMDGGNIGYSIQRHIFKLSMIG
jgi:hypothetical protein